MVGVALPFSIASRLAKGQSPLAMRAHAFGRALILVALGIFLRSLNQPQTYFTFEDTLTQIGLGYATLSFIPTLGTMILGLIAGQVLRSERSPWDRVRWLAAVGVAGLVSRSVLGALGVCPVVKRI